MPRILINGKQINGVDIVQSGVSPQLSRRGL